MSLCILVTTVSLGAVQNTILSPWIPTNHFFNNRHKIGAVAQWYNSYLPCAGPGFNPQESGKDKSIRMLGK